MVSDLVAYAMIPTLTFLALGLSAVVSGQKQQIPRDLKVLFKTLLISGAFNQMAKRGFKRPRPYVSRHPELYDDPSDANASFFSGHTTLAYSLVFGAARIAQARGYKAQNYIWAMGLPLASFVGYARVAAEKHYLSDVAVGAIFGACMGLWGVKLSGLGE